MRRTASFSIGSSVSQKSRVSRMAAHTASRRPREGADVSAFSSSPRILGTADARRFGLTKQAPLDIAVGACEVGEHAVHVEADAERDHSEAG